MMIDLRPCPFCGTEARISKAFVRVSNGKTKRLTGRKMKGKKVYYVIGCSDPDCILYNSGKQSSLLFTASMDGLEYMKRKWNRRLVEEV